MTNYACFGYSQYPTPGTLVSTGDHIVTVSIQDASDIPKQCNTTLSVLCESPSVQCPVTNYRIAVNNTCNARFPSIDLVDASL
jgi:hypothetical protein